MLKAVKLMNDEMNTKEIENVEVFVKEISEAFNIPMDEATYFYNELAIIKMVSRKTDYSPQEEKFVLNMVYALQDTTSKTAIFKLVSEILGRGAAGVKSKYGRLNQKTTSPQNTPAVKVLDELHMKEGHLQHKQPTLLSADMLEAAKELAVAKEGTSFADVMQPIGKENERGTDYEKKLHEELRNLKNELRLEKEKNKDLERINNELYECNQKLKATMFKMNKPSEEKQDKMYVIGKNGVVERIKARAN